MIKVNNNELENSLYGKYDIKKIIKLNVKEQLFLVKFNKGEFICHEGDPMEYLFFMVEGKLKVNVTQENGKTRLMCFLQDFQILGHIELFADKDYTSNVEALTDIYCFALDLSLFKEKLLNDTLFLRYSAKKLANTLLVNIDNSSFNLFYPLETRLATYIVLTSDGEIFKDNLTTMSELFASSYRQLTRVLLKLCKSGMLEKKSGYYKIIDFEKLKEYSNQTITHL